MVFFETDYFKDDAVIIFITEFPMFQTYIQSPPKNLYTLQERKASIHILMLNLLRHLR